MSGSRLIDIAFRTLSRSADKGRLWLGLAAVGVLTPGRTRRAAIRGAGSLAATSFTANVVLKPMFRRRRPDTDRTPLGRRLSKTPTTTSFPSGHAASAAAFATGAALEMPVAAVAITPVAAAVCWSRVHVGVHHVGDVAAGAALGVGLAVAARRWWPVRPQEPAQVRQRVRAPVILDGHGLVVVTNTRAGDAASHIRRLFPAAKSVDVAECGDIDTVIAGQQDVRALGVAGGDGTVASVAVLAMRHELALAVFPAGTFDNFAGEIGITSFDDTVQAMAAGIAAKVDVGTAGGVPFLNTSTIGAYPQIVRRRDELRPRFGKFPAMAIATAQVLRHQSRLRLRLDGRDVDVWSLFVGNGEYTPRGPFPTWRPRLDDGMLDVQYLQAGRLSRSRAALTALVGMTEHNATHHAKLVATLRVESRTGMPLEIARDGEAGEHATVFDFGKLPGHLTVYRPDDVHRP